MPPMSMRTMIKAMGDAGAVTAFVRSLVSGLDAATTLKVTAHPRAYQSRGLRGDWSAVGNDLRTAMKREDAARTA